MQGVLKFKKKKIRHQKVKYVWQHSQTACPVERPYSLWELARIGVGKVTFEMM